LKSIAARENKNISVLEDELATEMHRTFATLEKWRQGRIPPEAKQVELLARACVRRGSMDKQWLVRFLTQSRYPEKEALIRDLFPVEEPKEPSGPLIRHNLPRRSHEKFVGREKELAELVRYLSPRYRLGVVCLSGMPGVGKTALALEIAHRYWKSTNLSPEERFEAIVWVTAKHAELYPARLTPRRPTFTDLDGLYRAIAEVLGLEEITRAVTLSDRDVIVAHALADHRVLLVLDNLEDIDDSDLMVFLRELPPPSKAIVTTRHRIDVALSIHLKAFHESEAHKLIQNECQRHNLTLTNEQIERLLERTGCLALAIVRTIGRMAWRGSSVEAELRQLGDPSNDIYEFCFEKSIARIRGGHAHELFMALALFSKDATRDALGYVAGFDKDILDRDDDLSDLEVLSLVNKENGRFSLEALTKVKAVAELKAHLDFEREARMRWIEWHKQLAEQVEIATNFTHLQVEIDNLMSVIDYLIDQDDMVEVGWFFRRIRRFLFSEGRWVLLHRLSLQVATWAESVDNAELLADALNSLAYVSRKQADPEAIREWLERAQIAATRLRNELLQAEVWLNQVEILYYKPTSSQEEIRMVTRALEVFRKHNKPIRVAQALNALGNLYLKQDRLQEATRFYQEGLSVLEESGSKTPIALHWRAALRGNLGHVAGFQGQHAQACEILYEVLKEFTDQTDIAEAHAALALYEYQRGHIEQALLLRRQRDRIVKQLNLTLPLCHEDMEWKRLQLG
jgi:tetratricopeptide (TPR) repeat protein